MHTFTPKVKPLVVAVSLAFLALGAAQAQAEADQAASTTATTTEADGLSLDKVVITGTSTARSKMKQSVSVSTLDNEQLQNTVAASSAEVLRTVPGLRAESSGGEGNANLGVRGLPMSDGGGRYVQMQEDGLPVVLFGDMSFATADQFTRADFMTDTLEVIRGGSSSTMATNASGAIVNFRSKTGKEAGGSVGYSTGLDYREHRMDFTYGGKLTDTMNYQFGGFYRFGDGVRKSDVTTENGGQFRASLTKDLDGGSYVRLSMKHLKDRTPTYLPVPVTVSGNEIKEIPGIDPRKAFFVTPNFAIDNTVDKNGNKVSSNPADGLMVEVDSIGAEAKLNLEHGLQITDNFRLSSIGGRFIGVFPAGSAPTDPLNAANTYTGTTPVFSAHIFNTALDDMGNVFNDLRVQKEMAATDNNKLTLTGGLFSGIQNVGQTWYWNRYNIGYDGRLYDNAGNPTTGPVGDATTTWGGCCFRSINVQVAALAPYAAITLEQGPLSLDASIRHDSQRGSGTQKFGDGANGGTWNPAKVNTINYTANGTSYSVGGNYELQKSLAVFGRASHGESWKSPDRVVWDGAVDNGSAPYPVNKVDQFEAGAKYKGKGFSAFVTAFLAKTKEGAGYELTTQTVKQNSYDAKGVEAEASVNLGNMRLAGGATLTDAKITSGANDGKTPRRQAKLVYQASPSYMMGALEVGAHIIGTTDSYAQDDNTVKLPAFATVNAYANYELARNTVVSLGINNLFDTLGYTESEGQGNLTNNPLQIARAINGRSVKASLKYSF